MLRSISPVHLLVKPFYDVYPSINSLGISLEASMTRNVLKSTWSIRAPGGANLDDAPVISICLEDDDPDTKI